MNLLQQALRYRQLGWSIIPIERKSKLPALKSWKEYQERLPTNQEIQNWFYNLTPLNLAIVTGRISKLVVIDVDTLSIPLGLTNLNLISPISVKTGKGKHFYFRLKDNEIIPSRTRVFDNVDIRGDGGYIIAPPSIHDSGMQYRWINEPFVIHSLPYLPEVSKKVLYKEHVEEKNKSGWISEALQGLKEGNRDDTLFRICSRLRIDGYSESDCFTLLSPFADRVDAISILKEKIHNVWSRYGTKSSIWGLQSMSGDYRQPTKPKIYSPGVAADFDEYCKRRERKSSLQGYEISTGLSKLDHMLTGLQRGEIYTIGARTGIGKTTLCLNISANVLETNRGVLYLSTEMSFDSILDRVKLIMGSDDKLKESRLFVSDIGNPNQEQIREMINECKPDVLVFDHIQHLGDSITNRTQELSVMVKALKNIAREHDIVVLVASQLNRGADSINMRTGEKIKPQIYHLKEAGSIEEESSGVILMSKEYAIDDDHDIYDLNVGKNRFGTTGHIEMTFEKSTMRMYENNQSTKE